MFSNFGTPELILVAIVLLVIFGPKKLPEFARGIAEAIKEVKHAFNKEEGSDKEKK